VREGTTVLLTTQYLEEADELANQIAVIDRGLVIAEGTSDELKERVGGEVIELTVADHDRARDAADAIAAAASIEGADAKVDERTGKVVVPVRGGARVLPAAVRRLDAARIEIVDLSLRKPTLDDVFLALTGHAADEAAREQEVAVP